MAHLKCQPKDHKKAVTVTTYSHMQSLERKKQFQHHWHSNMAIQGRSAMAYKYARIRRMHLTTSSAIAYAQAIYRFCRQQHILQIKGRHVFPLKENEQMYSHCVIINREMGWRAGASTCLFLYKLNQSDKRQCRLEQRQRGDCNEFSQQAEVGNAKFSQQAEVGKKQQMANGQTMRPLTNLHEMKWQMGRIGDYQQIGLEHIESWQRFLKATVMSQSSLVHEPGA